MSARRRISSALLRLAALGGLLNLAGCLAAPAPVMPALGLVLYSQAFQANAGAELARAADRGGACYLPHLVTLVVDYGTLRQGVRAMNPTAEPVGERDAIKKGPTT